MAAKPNRSSAITVDKYRVSVARASIHANTRGSGASHRPFTSAFRRPTETRRRDKSPASRVPIGAIAWGFDEKYLLMLGGFRFET
jgi:hypothetical protein